MSYTIEAFASDCRNALSGEPGPVGLERVRLSVERALGDDAFLETHLGPEADSPRKILYEDADLSFCIISMVFKGVANGPPHNHGPEWAVYGQAAGVTEMTDWRLVESAEDGRPGKVEPVRTYDLLPGQAKLYAVGDVHSPRRQGDTRLLRVEGKNLDKIKRDTFEPAS